MPEPEIDLTPPPLPQPIEFEPEIIEVQAEKDEQKPEIKPEPITKAAPPKVSPPAPTTNVQAPPVQPGLPVEAAAPDPALIDRFIADFLRVVEKNKFYPPKAKRVGLTGTVKVRVTFDRQGRVGQITLVAGDYDPELGQGALETIRRAAGRWRPRQGGPEVLVVPIGFKLR
jgi:protein TonB